MYHFSNSLLKNTLHSLTKKSNHTSKKRRNFGLILFFTWNSSTRGVGYVQHWGLFLAVAAADVVLVVLVELDQRTHSPGGDSTDAVVGLGHQHHHRRAPVFFQVGKFLPQKGCLWVYLFDLRQVTRTQALDASADGHYRWAGRRARASFPGESKDCDDCLEAKWSQQSEQQTPESNNNSERLR